ncbi:glycosyltransferase [Methylorubrum zatmanii]|uniref:Glycosyltransferase n=1 Tax=Methylorubrum zatmanii TaxID=29429 RepID=A0ABW1WQV3_9HYPH|nr:glycosyltransferase [Methylorubrum zatmanii]MBD8909329.1 glycosyl transferase [Methylorubrum zatmanii]
MGTNLGPAVVCVPARNEAERLPRLLRALAAQEGFSAAAPLKVIVVANNCTDGTADSARALEGSGAIDRLALRLIEATYVGIDAHVGTARRRALDEGAAWLEAAGTPHGALLTTDADAWLDPSWVGANLRALERAEIVGGRLVIDEDETDPALAAFHARVERYWSGVRALEDALDPPPHDPAPRHGDHTGGSLALRASLYRAVGGLPAIPRGEDNALVAAVQRAGGRLRHCPAVSVRVSARTAGRAEGGMATEMLRRARVVRDGEAYRLPEAAHWQRVILRRAALRRAFREGASAASLHALGLDAADLAAIDVPGCPNDIAFVERAHARLEARDGPAAECGLDEAVAGLDNLAASLRPEAAA